jgi:hypothetical protein
MDKKGPTFWDTKEGTLGMFIGILLFGAGAYGLYKILPFIVSLLSNLLTAGLLLLVIGILFYVLILDDKLRNFVGLRYKLLMRAMLYSAIKEDPAAILRLTQAEDERRMAEIKDGMGKAQGTVQTLKEGMDKFQTQALKIKREYDHLLSHGGSQLELSSRAKKVEQLNRAYGELKKPFDHMTLVVAQFQRASDYQEARLDDVAFQIDLAITKYKAMKSLGSVLKMFKNVFTGTDENAQMQKTAFEVMSEADAMTTGQIDAFLTDSKKLLDARDIQAEIMAEDGAKLLEDLSSRNFEILSQQKPKVVADGNYYYLPKK